MPKIPLISAKEAIKAFKKIGFSIISQKGSHIKISQLNFSRHFKQYKNCHRIGELYLLYDCIYYSPYQKITN